MRLRLLAMPQPPADAEILCLSACELARRLRARQLRSVAVVQAHIARAEATHQAVNAIVADRFAAALQEAAAADERLDSAAAADLPPLLGVPCTIKESFGFAGMPNTAGLLSRRGVQVATDAVTVMRIRQAGAIPIGVTNTSELCMWLESSNRVYGCTNNPYDRRRMVGGSSGGEGAIVASGASPFGIGSDIGGSIRLPAQFCGVFGHKCSSGLIPNSGQFPVAHGDASRMLSAGPLCRKAEDLWPLVLLLAGPDGRDEACVPRVLGDPATVDVGKLRVFVIDKVAMHRASAAQRHGLERAVQALRDRGADVRPVAFAGMAESFLLWSQRLSAASPQTFHQLLGGDNDAPDLRRELGKWVRGKSAHTLPALGLAVLEKVPFLAGGDVAVALGKIADLRKRIEDTLGDDGVIVQPTFPRQATRHHVQMLRPMESGWTGIYNALELPATHVPTGLRAGLPTGVQVVGRHGKDHVTVAVALTLEQALGGWVPPWTVPGGI